MSLYRDEGVVLRTQKLGEADRIITLLTRAHGRVRAVGKGVRRTTSRFGARLEPFTHVDVQLYAGRVARRRARRPRRSRRTASGIVDDYPRYTAGTAMLETAERFTAEEREPAVQQFLLLVGALRALGRGRARRRPGARRLPAARARRRRLRAVVRRLRPVRRRRAAPGSSRRGRRRGLRRLPAARRRRAGARDTLRPAGGAAHRRLGRRRRERGAARARGSGLVAAYLQWHLERGLRSLPLVERK